MCLSSIATKRNILTDGNEIVHYIIFCYHRLPTVDGGFPCDRDDINAFICYDVIECKVRDARHSTCHEARLSSSITKSAECDHQGGKPFHFA